MPHVPAPGREEILCSWWLRPLPIDRIHAPVAPRDWEGKKFIIGILYMDQNLNLQEVMEVMEVMASKHSFRAT